MEILRNMKPDHFFKVLTTSADCEKYKNYIFYIDGRTGPTGKTYLTMALTDFGYQAIDISEELTSSCLRLVKNSENTYYFCDERKMVLIVLNTYISVRKRFEDVYQIRKRE